MNGNDDSSNKCNKIKKKNGWDNKFCQMTNFKLKANNLAFTPIRLSAVFFFNSSQYCSITLFIRSLISIKKEIHCWHVCFYLSLTYTHKLIIYIYIYIRERERHTHHQIVWITWSSLIFFLATHPYHPLLLAGLLNGIQCPHRTDVYVFASWLTLLCPCIVVHKIITHELVLMSPTVPSMSCSSYFVVCKIGGKWPDSCSFVACYFQQILY